MLKTVVYISQSKQYLGCYISVGLWSNLQFAITKRILKHYERSQRPLFEENICNTQDVQWKHYDTTWKVRS